jgi:hypothetical protein
MILPHRRPVRRWARATTLAAVAGLALAGCSEDPRPTSGSSATEAPSETPGESTSEEPTEQPPSESTEDPGSTETAEPSGTAVAVYFVGDGPGGQPRLLREFHRVTGDPLVEAARLVTGGGQPDDPDYRTLGPQVEVASVQATDGVLLVDIPSDAFTERPDGMTKKQATLALQQLVYTLQGVQQERIPVVVERSEAEPSLFGVSTETEFTAASPLRTLNLVSITSPAEGDTVTGDTLRVTGVANSFEASGPCRLLAGGEELALEPYQAEGWMEDRLFPFEVELPLEGITGEVTIQCETDDPSGGAEGNGPSVDTKTITVQQDQ